MLFFWAVLIETCAELLVKVSERLNTGVQEADFVSAFIEFLRFIFL